MALFHNFRCRFPVIAVLAIFAATTVQAAEPARLLSGFPKSRLIIDTSGSGCVLFDVYVAQTYDQRSQGLMHIESLGEYEGMVFLYGRPATISMWMRNTLIPLDMLFIGTDSRIESIHANAVPLSEAIIESGPAAIGVIELNGGAARRFNIETGNQVIFPAG